MIVLFEKAFGILLCLGVLMMQPSCLRDSYEVKLSGPMTVGSEWVELRPDRSFKADKDFQLVVLELEPPFKDDLYKDGKGPNKGQGILMPDGEVINPEIQVIDQYGNTFDLVYRGARRSFWPAYGLSYPNEWPREREYKIVRIRSPKPIKCKAVYWFCESTKDLK